MKSPTKWLTLLAGVMLAFLGYVHLQTEVFQVSYSIVHKENYLAQLSDEYRSKKYQVSKLKSLMNLDKRRDEIDIPLVVPEKIEVIRVPIDHATDPLLSSSPLMKKGWFNLSGWIREAQAKTSSR